LFLPDFFGMIHAEFGGEAVMRERRFLSAVLLLAMLFATGSARPAQIDQSDLPKILKAAGDYCEVVKRMALFFVCRERILEKENVLSRGRPSSRTTADAISVSKVNRRDFVYDYQIIKKGDDVREQRTLLEENGRPRRQENADLPTLKYSGRNLVFGPVGFLSRYWQEHFDFEVNGREEVDGRAALIIRAAPKSETQENNNHGRIWVDASTFQILRIELEPQAVQGQEVELQNDFKIPGVSGASFQRRLAWVVDYSFEKNGVRFPSRQTIRESYQSDTGVRVVKREVVFDYSDYKFFTVEVDVR
jgi:hypothetical protein